MAKTKASVSRKTTKRKRKTAESSGGSERRARSRIYRYAAIADNGKVKETTLFLPTESMYQFRDAASPRSAYGCGTHSRIVHEREQWLTRNELARLYHWKQRNRLAPLNINKRQI